MKKFIALILLGLIGIPIMGYFPIGGTPVWSAHYISLTFLLFLGVSFVLWDFNKWLGVFSAMCLISTFFVSKGSIRALAILIQFDLLCLVAYGVSKFDKNCRKWIIGGIAGFVIMQSGWLVLQYFNLDPMFFLKNKDGADVTKNVMVGFMGSTGQLGATSAIVLPLMAYIHPLLALLCFGAICVSKSSFALVAGMSSGLIYFFLTNKKLFKIAVIVCLIVGTFFFGKLEYIRGVDFQMRFEVWKSAVSCTVKGELPILVNNQFGTAKCNPILGYGFGNFLKIFPYVPGYSRFNFDREKFAHAHNDYVETFFELGYMGLIGIILLLGGFANDFIKATKSRELAMAGCCIIAYLLCSLGNFNSQIAVSGLLVMLCYGMFRGCLNGKT